MEANIIEGNKLIAEFRGFKKPIFIGVEKNDTLVSNIKGCFGHYSPQDLKFHSHWNWLMAVVEQIESLDISQFGEIITKDVEDISGNFWFKTYLNIVQICVNVDYYYKDGEIIGLNEHEKSTKLESTWFAVVEFIKWYNQHKIN